MNGAMSIRDLVDSVEIVKGVRHWGCVIETPIEICVYGSDSGTF